MIYPKKIEEKLGFDHIRRLLKNHCEGSLGQLFVDKIRFMHDYALIDKLICQTQEFVQLLSAGEDFPQQHFVDLSALLSKAEIPGSWLSRVECYQLQQTLHTLRRCLYFFRTDSAATNYAQLCLLAQDVDFDDGLTTQLAAVLDEKGQIKDNASVNLAALRKQMRNAQAAMQHRLTQIWRQYQQQGYIKDGLGPTLRDGRMVLPVPAQHKRHIKGFIHDASASGQTFFIEPEELLQSNNALKNLALQEQQEIVRILTQLTDRLRPEIPHLKKANRYLGIIDFIRAKARLAQELEAIAPKFVDYPYIEWYGARHPLLFYRYRESGKKVVSQQIKLSEEVRILVISGPNAGGKSVTLKTVGLIQYMFQSGLPVPLAEGSCMGIFNDIFLDLGDEQSIENDLSTYSSHLTNMRTFVRKAASKSLCLIDEFGAGTEPELGAAIAEAILEKLNQKKVFGVITTHYANLKFFADKTPGLLNGAMRYDVANIRPLYVLSSGMPGSSFALEIAENIGLPEEIMTSAREKVGKHKVHIEKLLLTLEKERKEAETARKQAQQKQKMLDEQHRHYQKLNNALQNNRQKLMQQARTEAAKLLDTANRKIEHTIRTIKENRAEKEPTKQVRKALEVFKADIRAVEPPIEPTEAANDELAEAIKILGGTAQVGDYVQLIGQQAVGEVLDINKKEATLRIGALKTKIKIDRLLRISKRKYLRYLKEKEKNTFAKVSYNPQTVNQNKQRAAFSIEIDLRGKRAEEIVPLLQDFLDTALMLDQKKLRIVHGKGNGILRQVVRNFLTKVKEVTKFADEHADRGGNGVTLITLC